MRAFGALIFGLLMGVLAVLLADRSEEGRSVVSRVRHTLHGFVDGVVEAFAGHVADRGVRRWRLLKSSVAG